MTMGFGSRDDEDESLLLECQRLRAENELLKAQGDAQTNLDLSIQVSHLIAENEKLQKLAWRDDETSWKSLAEHFERRLKSTLEAK